ncbi:MAG: hypothetical protein NZ899_05915 [Thermoguttaceae bacterium]|nr:hypothetical protein [Thermoguttaceae bacterium]MDW8079477.1 hypothetical protein [Thermoguttaceae bacterium]
MVIHSPRGIGWAEVTPRQPWPDRVVIRLFLRGLEHLRIATGEFELVVSVRSYGDFAREVRLRKSPEGQGNEGPQSPGDPFWVKVKAHSAAGEETPGLPPPGGYWEIELPSQLFREHSCPLRLDWIDFYRY